MRIIDIEIGRESIPLKKPFITALRRVDTVQFVRVKIVTEEGFSGIGEAPPTKAITGEDTETITSTIRSKIIPRFLHEHFSSMEDAQRLLHACCEGQNSAKAAFDIALYDLFAKRAGQPLYAYLGGSANLLQTDVTISLNHPETMAQDARTAIAEGFDILKIKVGGHDGLDSERIRAVRTAAAHATLLIDANQAWSEAETLEEIRAVRDLDITLIEQPVPAKQLNSLRRITAQSTIAVLADESVFSLNDAEKVLNAHAAHMINIKLMKCGGIYKAAEIVRFCERRNITCMIGSMLEGPVSIAAAAHLAMAYPETVRYLDLDSPLLYAALPDGSPVGFKQNTLLLHHQIGI